jgi:hypothetical protein
MSIQSNQKSSNYNEIQFFIYQIGIKKNENLCNVDDKMISHIVWCQDFDDNLVIFK